MSLKGLHTGHLVRGGRSGCFHEKLVLLNFEHSTLGVKIGPVPRDLYGLTTFILLRSSMGVTKAVIACSPRLNICFKITWYMGRGDLHVCGCS